MQRGGNVVKGLVVGWVMGNIWFEVLEVCE